MKELKYNLKSMLMRSEFYFAFITIFLLQILHFYLNLNFYVKADFTIRDAHPAVYQTSVLSNIIPFGLITMIIFPALCNLLYSDSAYMEKKYRVHIYLKHRLDIKKDWLSKCFLCFIASFVMCFFSYLLNALLCFLVYDSGSFSDIFGSGVYEKITYPFLFLEGVRQENNILYLFLNILFLSNYIGLFTVLSLQVSKLVKNRIYILLSVPILLIGIDIVLTIIGLKQYSIFQQIQTPCVLTLAEYSLSLVILLLIIAALILFNLRNLKDEFL